jgi:hypothetical protein
MAVRAVIDANVLVRGLLAAEGPPRWRNTAQWARNDLREQGLIRDDTPRSVWEITDKGRQWLRVQGGAAPGG